MTPCAVGNVKFRLALPEPDEMQISIVGEFKERKTYFYTRIIICQVKIL